MLKFLFWTLLLANVSLLVYEQGYLAAWLPDGHEPERMAHQFNTESMKIIPAGQLDAKPADADATAATAATRADPASCSEIGGFDQATAKRFDTALQPLALGDKLVRHESEDVAHNIVYIPSQGSKEGAEKKATELRHLGISDFFIIQDAGDLHWGISLGVFKTEEAARAQLATLSQKGVHSARLGNHNVSSTKVSYQLRNLDTAGKASLDKILLEFPHAEKHACDADAGADNKVEAKPDNKPPAKPDLKPDVKTGAKPATPTPPAKAALPRDATH